MLSGNRWRMRPKKRREIATCLRSYKAAELFTKASSQITLIILIYTDQKSSTRTILNFVNPCHPCSSVVRFAFCVKQKSGAVRSGDGRRLLVDRDRLVRGGFLRLLLIQEIHYYLNYGILAQRSIDHGVVNLPVGPFRMEIVLDKGGALAVNRIYQRLGMGLRIAFRNKSLHLVSRGSVQEEAKRVLAALQKMLRSAAQDYAIAGSRCLLNNAQQAGKCCLNPASPPLAHRDTLQSFPARMI